MGPGEGIVQQAPRQWLALRAEDDVFSQGLSKTLGNAADYLPFDQPWVDDVATVMHPNIAQDGDLSRLPAYRHDHGMCTKGERGSRQGIGATEHQPALWRDGVG